MFVIQALKNFLNTTFSITQNTLRNKQVLRNFYQKILNLFTNLPQRLVFNYCRVGAVALFISFTNVESFFFKINVLSIFVMWSAELHFRLDPTTPAQLFESDKQNTSALKQSKVRRLLTRAQALNSLYTRSWALATVLQTIETYLQELTTDVYPNTPDTYFKQSTLVPTPLKVVAEGFKNKVHLLFTKYPTFDTLKLAQHPHNRLLNHLFSSLGVNTTTTHLHVKHIHQTTCEAVFAKTKDWDFIIVDANISLQTTDPTLATLKTRALKNVAAKKLNWAEIRDLKPTNIDETQCARNQINHYLLHQTITNFIIGSNADKSVEVYKASDLQWSIITLEVSRFCDDETHDEHNESVLIDTWNVVMIKPKPHSTPISTKRPRLNTNLFEKKPRWKQKTIFSKPQTLTGLNNVNTQDNFSPMRKNRVYIKSRFSRVRQWCRPIVMWTLWLNIFLLFWCNSVFYGIKIKLSYVAPALLFALTCLLFTNFLKVITRPEQPKTLIQRLIYYFWKKKICF